MDDSEADDGKYVTNRKVHFMGIDAPASVDEKLQAESKRHEQHVSALLEDQRVEDALAYLGLLAEAKARHEIDIRSLQAEVNRRGKVITTYRAAESHWAKESCRLQSIINIQSEMHAHWTKKFEQADRKLFWSVGIAYAVGASLVGSAWYLTWLFLGR